eukprot:jgi/Tetstr1/423636/TSEL_014272.t1
MDDSQATVTVGVWQGSAVAAVTAGNLATVERVLREEAPKAGAKLVVFPELFLCGYDCSAAQLAAGAALALDSDTLRAVARAAGEAGVAVALGYAERGAPVQPGAPDALYDAVALFDATGALAANYRKVLPPTGEPPSCCPHPSAAFVRSPFLRENDGGRMHYTHIHAVSQPSRRLGKGDFVGGDPGQLAPVSVAVSGGGAPLRVGVALAYDLEFPEAARALAVQGAALLLAPGALATGALEVATPFRTLPTRALENNAYLAFANLEGPAAGPPAQRVASFAGCSAILDPTGENVVRTGTLTGGQLLTAAVKVGGGGAEGAVPAYLAERAARLAEGHYAVLTAAAPAAMGATAIAAAAAAAATEAAKSLGTKPRGRGGRGRSRMELATAAALATLLPDIHSVANPTADGKGEKRAREGDAGAEAGAGEGDAKAASSRRGRRVLCMKCSRPSRSVCSACGASVCSSSVPRPCFAQHVADHCLAAGWLPAAPAGLQMPLHMAAGPMPATTAPEASPAPACEAAAPSLAPAPAPAPQAVPAPEAVPAPALDAVPAPEVAPAPPPQAELKPDPTPAAEPVAEPTPAPAADAVAPGIL